MSILETISCLGGKVASQVYTGHSAKLKVLFVDIKKAHAYFKVNILFVIM